MAVLLPSKPGWYPNPAERSSLRYWDGRVWTSRLRPRPPWMTGLADLEAGAEDFEGLPEGPVHPHELRAPVASGAYSRGAPALWKALQSQRPRHRPTGPASEGQRPPGPPVSAKFGVARRPLLVFVVMVVVAVAVVISSVLIISPYEHTDDPHFTAPASASAFGQAATKACTSTLPKDRSAFLAASDGPTIMAASRQVDTLRQQLQQRLDDSPVPQIDQAAVVAWLSEWRQFDVYQRRFATIIGAASARNGLPWAQVLGPQQREEALVAKRQAFDEADVADNHVDNLDILSCRLLLGSPE